MRNDRLQQNDGSMAESPKVCGGVVMERKMSMIMKKSMNSVLRVAMVAVLTMVLGVAGVVSNSDAAVSTYRWQIDTGTNLGGITTNWSAVCGAQSQGAGTVAMMTTAAFGCASDRIEVTAGSVPLDVLTLIKDTPYATDNTITGQATGNRWYFRDGGAANDKVVRLSLGYVTGGAYTELGFVDTTVPNGTRALYFPDTSGITGVAPAGSYLATKIIIQSDTSDYLRLYLADANAVGDQAGAIAVDEVAAPSDITPPSAGTVTITSPAAGTATYIPADITFETVFTDAESAVTCQYTTNGSTWLAGTISGAGPYTCSASPTGLTGAVTLNMRGTSAGGGPTTATALTRTVDATGPTDGVLTVTAGNAQNVMTWTAATDSGSGLRTTNTYDLRWLTGATPPTCTGGLSAYTGPLLTFTHTPLTNGTQYIYRLCAYDNFNNVSTGTTGSGTPVATTAPTLTLPTAISISDTTATLGANITTNGGAAITQRGTLWGPATNPNTNLLLEGGTALGLFSSARSGLPASTLVYYRGYANNAVGTGFSPTGSFYTEPTTQATAVNFTAVGSTAMTVNWTVGSGDGVIVLMKADTVVNAPPVDGTFTGYTANTLFGSGTQIGTGNYVVAKGAGNSVTVTGLTAGTTYHVAAYAYKGVVDTAGVNQGVNYKLIPAIGNASTAVGCTRVAPTVTMIPTAQIVSSGGNVVYVLSITNNDTGVCAATTFGAAVTGDVDVANAFDPVLLSAASTSVAPGITDASLTLTVTNNGTGVNGNQSVATVTVSDATNHSGMNQAVVATTTFQNFNPMIHSSLSTGSTKWAGKWGTSQVGSKYGAFTCNTCHAKNTGNIKRVKGALTSGTADLFPIQAAAGTVSLLSVVEGSSGFGNDTPTHATSNKICEGCHSITNYHRYNTIADPDGAGPLLPQADLTHYNQSNCIACHKHSEGFKPAGCTGCHGSTVTGQYWPDGASGNPAYADDNAGAHNNHVESISQYLGYGDINLLLLAADTATKQKAICAFCHLDPGGSGHSTDSAPTSRVDVVAAGGFSKFTGAGTSALDTTSGAYNTTTFSCSNIVCHNQIATPTGVTNWNTPPAAPTCALCHTGAGATQRHDVHVTTEGYACTQCHSDNGTYPTGTAGLRHGDGLVNLKWDNAGSFEATYGGGAVTYSQVAPLPYKDATWGTCASAACHNNTTTPAWNAAAVNTCSVCHAAGPADATHTAHTGAAATYGRVIDCASCHDAATTTTTPPASGHINGIFAVAGNVSFTYPQAYPAKQSCGTNVCHNDGTNTASVSGTYTWGTPKTLGCALCHAATPASNAHNEHMTGYSAVCTDCHTAANLTTHLNGNINVDAAKATYSRTASVATGGLPNGTCATAACHNRGTPVTQSIAWNVAVGNVAGVTDLACNACHFYAAGATTGAANTAFGTMQISTSHNDHLNKGFLCSRCHTITTTTAAHISGKTSLIDGSVAVVGEAASGVSVGAPTSYTYSSPNCTNGGGTPNNGIGCHATGTPAWGTAFAITACTNCHTNTITAAVNPTSGLHNITVGASVQRHDSTITGGCVACHSSTPPASHANGTFTANSAANTDRFVNRTNMTHTDAAGNAGTCFGTGLVGCHSDGGNWYRQWSTAANSIVATPGNARCDVCHGQWTTWSAGTTHFKAGVTQGNGHEPATPNCDACHVYGASGNSRHNTNSGAPAQRRIEVNSNGSAYARTNDTYGSGTAGCSQCHSATNAGYSFPISFFANNPVSGTAIPMPACASCHSEPTKAATVPQVSIGNSHTDWNGSVANTPVCEDCHAGHADGTSGPNDVEISTAGVATMNWSYSTHGSRIKLGGTQTGKTFGPGPSVTFTAPGTIAGTAIGTATFKAGDIIQVTGSTSNGTTAVPKYFTVTVVAANQLTVSGGTITTEAASTTEVISNCATEAQICWNCHNGKTDTVNGLPISEWALNTDTNGTATDYDYGDLYIDATTITSPVKNANWVSGIWRSGKGRGATGSANDPFWYKRGAIQSTHTANPAVTDAALSGSIYKHTETPNTVEQIRCSYCHDVHGTHATVNGDTSGPTANNGPYLRGTWKGNPYPEDGAPQWGMTNWEVERTGVGGYGKVPRATASQTNSGLSTVATAGGFWIDQNSGNPNSGANATDTSGLCAQCHGADNNGTWTNAELAVIDQNTGAVEKTGATYNLWVSGYNGHANVVLKGQAADAAGPGRGVNGSTESYARNVYTRTKRGSASYTRRGSNGFNDMGLATEGSAGYSYRAGETDGRLYYPRVGGNTDLTAGTTARVYAFRTFVWGGTTYRVTNPAAAHDIASGTVSLQVADTTGVLGATVNEAANYDSQANYHTFNCGKCHNPHASRLPKLMITNCLDTNHNTWDNRADATYTAVNPGDFAYSDANVTAPFATTRASQWSSAQNCHRLDEDASRATSLTIRGPGWNRVTPWNEFATPGTGLPTNPNP